MRGSLNDTLRIRFRRRLVAARTDMEITQSDMSQMLAMSLRSYSDLESGKSGCSATTLVLFLVRICPDPMAFLEELREAMCEETEGGCK